MPATLTPPDVTHAELADRRIPSRADAEVPVPTTTLADETEEVTRRRAEAYLALVHWLDRL